MVYAIEKWTCPNEKKKNFTTSSKKTKRKNNLIETEDGKKFLKEVNMNPQNSVITRAFFDKLRKEQHMQKNVIELNRF